MPSLASGFSIGFPRTGEGGFLKICPLRGGMAIHGGGATGGEGRASGYGCHIITTMNVKRSKDPAGSADADININKYRGDNPWRRCVCATIIKNSKYTKRKMARSAAPKVFYLFFT